MARKETSSKIILKDGAAVNVRVLDGLVVDDLIIQGAKAEGYRVMTGRNRFPEYGRDIKDYLIKINVITD